MSRRECKLGECIEVINGYAFKSQNFLEEQIENSLPVVKIKNVANGDVNLKAVQFHLFDKNLEKYLIQKNDVLIALTGNHPQAITQVVGEVSKYKLGELAFLNQRVAKIKARENMSNDFLYYFLKDDASHDYLASQSSGSANQANISKSDIENMPISLPPLEEQKAIAEVLSSLDDKIDLLHRQNQTLESLAQTLFRQWFIEEAKEEWEEKPLSKIADFLNGLACQKFPPKNDIDKLPVLKIKDLKDGVSENSDYATSDVKPENIVNNGDVIFAWSASLMVKIWNGDKCVLNQHLFKVISKDYPKWFYYQWCKYHLDNFIDIASEHATTMGHIKRSDLGEAICLVPNIDELDKMTEQFNPIMEKLEINSRQIQTLENLRDTLLPKLLSGEVRVKI
ncbi:restriction endonuclease subunit S [Aliarcobacter sp.]|uniref:restriction endonuclease subunit S n=1 Tax=Aliarcobacter sp. TaxID=2321116 RepID=UPI003561D887